MPDKPENSAFKLLSSRKTLVMATADKNGAPNVSYAPFVHRAPPTNTALLGAYCVTCFEFFILGLTSKA
jgi:Pyridoxamine 5'-phosphate oxidase